MTKAREKIPDGLRGIVPLRRKLQCGSIGLPVFRWKIGESRRLRDGNDDVDPKRV